MRLFVAVALAPDVARRVAETLPDVPGARRAPAEQLHLTLAFIGQVDAARLPDAGAALERAVRGHGPIDVALGRLGRFPDRGAPHTIWIGVERGAAELSALAASVRAALAAVRVPFDAKPFRPHITVARLRDGDVATGRDIVAALERASAKSIAFRADAVTLFESVLSSKGARYTARAVVPLDAGGGRSG